MFLYKICLIRCLRKPTKVDVSFFISCNFTFSLMKALVYIDIFGIPSMYFFAVFGAIVGSLVWWRRPQNRLNADEYIQYKVCLHFDTVFHFYEQFFTYNFSHFFFQAMLISLATHLLLLMFELLVADKLDSPDRHMWILVFVPLVFISLISIPICIWSIRHDRSYELELFCAVNMLQFIFLALKLDK